MDTPAELYWRRDNISLAKFARHKHTNRALQNIARVRDRALSVEL